MRYQVLTKSFIDGKIYDPQPEGDPVYVEYDGVPGSNLRAVDGKPTKQKPEPAEARKRMHAAAETENPNAAKA